MAIFKRLFFKPIKTGKNFYCGPGTYIRPNSLIAGNNVVLGRNCRIANSKVIIGNDVMMGSSCALIDKSDHRYDETDKPMIYSKRSIDKPIHIENNVWIGYGAIILSGVTIHTGAVIGAGSVVTKNVARDMIAVGNPAYPLKKRIQ